MFGWGECTEKFNPEILFAFHAEIDGSKNIPIHKYHCHDFLELSIVIDGEVDYYIESKEYLVKSGEVLLSNPGSYHKEITENGSKYSQLHIGINNFTLSSIRENYIDNKGRGPIIKLERYKDEFISCCHEIIKEEKRRQVGYEIILKSLIMRLLITLYRELNEDENIERKDVYHCSFQYSEKQNVVKAIVEYMEKNYMEDLSLDKISKNMYLSSVYISKIFKEETGDSPINHLIKIRLTKARELLTTGDLSIKAVANSVGYSDSYHFSKLFKKYFGQSPSECRNSADG